MSQPLTSFSSFKQSIFSVSRVCNLRKSNSYIIIVNKTLIIRYAVSSVNFEVIDTPTVHWGSLGSYFSIFDLHRLHVCDIVSCIFLSKATHIQNRGKMLRCGKLIIVNFTLLSDIDIRKPKSISRVVLM